MSIQTAIPDEALQERLELSASRIREMLTEDLPAEPFGDFFRKMAQFIVFTGDIGGMRRDGSYDRLPLQDLARINRTFYEDVLPDEEGAAHYSASYANPACAAEKLGPEYGPLFSWLNMEIRGLISLTFQGRWEDVAQIQELFLQVYFSFRMGEELPSPEELRRDLYWYVSDYADYTVPMRVREQLDPSLTFYKDIILTSDLEDARYLYSYGDYISEDELGIYRYLHGKEESFIEEMAKTLVQGYLRGFELYRIDLSKKKNVQLRANIGFERVLRAVIRQFASHGLDCIVMHEAVRNVDKKSGRTGLQSVYVNPQMDYDHRMDRGLYLDGSFTERILEETGQAYEQYQELAAVWAGPALMEIFGKKPFEPAECGQRVQLTKKQQGLDVRLTGQTAQIVNRYINAATTSFSIIAWPIPSIGSRFEEIMDETVRVNNLDNDFYRQIQQRMIDALDGADHVHVTGRGGNRTDIRVGLWQLQDPEKETVFENCCADVNIPVGEIFTSPVLEGTRGVLNVSGVYLNGLYYRNLTLSFQDGFVVDYGCDNFEDPALGRAYIEQNLLERHPALPLGEFAIGTNTTAYTMARKFGIEGRMPILIMEKTGPHFAVGDTCYSHSEDHRVYNTDGKEIVARDNSVSRLRESDPEKAYFNVHTDITIPYDEIGAITAVFADGKQIDILREGRFVLPGTEALNEAL